MFFGPITGEDIEEEETTKMMRIFLYPGMQLLTSQITAQVVVVLTWATVSLCSGIFLICMRSSSS
jgi:hypothetical protein